MLRPQNFKLFKNKAVHNCFTFLLICILLYPGCISTIFPATGVSVPSGGAELGVIKLIAVTVRLTVNSSDNNNNNHLNHYNFFMASSASRQTEQILRCDRLLDAWRDEVIYRLVITHCFSQENYFFMLFDSVKDWLRRFYVDAWRLNNKWLNSWNFGSKGPGSSSGLGHCNVFLGKTLYPHRASLHPGV